jgi:hypothetical protein
MMTKFILITSCILLSLSSFSQEEDKIKYRKLVYADFLKHSINDTSEAIIDIYFDKKYNYGIGQMSLLPINLITYFISPPLATGLAFITVPLFINGSRVLIKYRNKKLVMVLNEYKATGHLPKGLRKIAIRELEAKELMHPED